MVRVQEGALLAIGVRRHNDIQMVDLLLCHDASVDAKASSIKDSKCQG